jgi:hypothetical protein
VIRKCIALAQQLLSETRTCGASICLDLNAKLVRPITSLAQRPVTAALPTCSTSLTSQGDSVGKNASRLVPNRVHHAGESVKARTHRRVGAAVACPAVRSVRSSDSSCRLAENRTRKPTPVRAPVGAAPRQPDGVPTPDALICTSPGAAHAKGLKLHLMASVLNERSGLIDRIGTLHFLLVASCRAKLNRR